VFGRFGVVVFASLFLRFTTVIGLLLVALAPLCKALRLLGDRGSTAQKILKITGQQHSGNCYTGHKTAGNWGEKD
jgi:inner membrane protein involved in colicin E2 resistance